MLRVTIEDKTDPIAIGQLIEWARRCGAKSVPSAAKSEADLPPDEADNADEAENAGQQDAEGKPRRTRRTKAQIKADEEAEAAAKAAAAQRATQVAKPPRVLRAWGPRITSCRPATCRRSSRSRSCRSYSRSRRLFRPRSRPLRCRRSRPRRRAARCSWRTCAPSSASVEAAARHGVHIHPVVEYGLVSVGAGGPRSLSEAGADGSGVPEPAIASRGGRHSRAARGRTLREPSGPRGDHGWHG